MARLRVSIVFESGARIGPGKAKLLESIRDTGSISAAAREMGMSYKRAWLLLDSMNQAFTELVPCWHCACAKVWWKPYLIDFMGRSARPHRLGDGGYVRELW